MQLQKLHPLIRRIKTIFSNEKSIIFLWIILAIASIIQYVILKEKHNNYLIFKGVFWHTIEQKSLFSEYPNEYSDTNHYGILFSIIIAPFAILGNKLGCSLWIFANLFFLIWAIRQIPISKAAIVGIMLISAHDFYASIGMQQFNPSLVALLVGAFVFIEKRKEHWATLFIVICFLTKIYVIVGLAFFFFANYKFRFVWSGILWLGLLFCLPMLYSSPEFVLSQYKEWFISLSEKNALNTEINLQNLSLLGFLQRTGIYDNNLIIITIGIIIFSLPYLRIQQYQYLNFRLMFLASVCLFICLFSTGTENSTYIIAYVGIGIWYMLSPNNSKWKNFLLVLAILGSLSHTDLFKPIKETYIIRYSLRAISPSIIWLSLIYEMCFMDYGKTTNTINKK